MLNSAGTRSKTIVLVTNQFQCERIINSGKTLADVTDTELCVFSVQNAQNPENIMALDHLFRVSKNHGAIMNVIYSEDSFSQIIHFIKHTKTRNVLTGIPQGKDSILYQIWDKFKRINFFTVDEEGNTTEVSRTEIPAHTQVMKKV